MSSARLLRLDRDACLDLEHGLRTEWLETDGRGGYASSTVLFCATRRYHGLLVTAPPGNARRHVFLSRFEETAHGPEGPVVLSMARYPGTFDPQGRLALECFELVPWPRATYRVGGALVRREVLLVRGEAVALVRWSVSGSDVPFELELRPLVAFREADALTFRNDALDGRVAPSPSGFSLRPYGALPALHLSLGARAHAFTPLAVWYRDVEYAEELRRGFPGHEDLFSPGVLRASLSPAGEGSALVVAAALHGPVADPAALWETEARRREHEASAAARPASHRARLALAADDFLVRSPTGRLGVDAGFPWFGEWGRDTFVALPGLTLARGRLHDCTAVLAGALEYLREGLLPNVFGADPDGSDYGSADAALWFARAVLLWQQAGGARRFLLDELLPALAAIAEAYRGGTALGIAADEDELLRVGSRADNATWMDARVDGVPVTPRDGFPVEIQALWYSLLQHLEELFGERGERAAARLWAERRRKARRAFLARFWLADEERLADRWKGGAPDRGVRPNMVIAAALVKSPLARAQRRGVLRCAEAELLTPRGLRTLSPRDPAYRGRYAGGPAERDGAYHQGTVWPWLLGSWVEARLRAFGPRRAEIESLSQLLAGVEEEVDRAGLEHVSEVFDGDPPHEPGGSIAQAWNTGELLRAHRLLEAARRGSRGASERSLGPDARPSAR